MGKEGIKLMKLEEINKEDYPEELKEQGAAALLLSCLMHTRVSYKTALALDKLKSNILCCAKRHLSSHFSRKRLRISPTRDSGAVVRRNHFDDQEDEPNIKAADRNLPGVPPQLNLELAFKLIDDYVPSEVPSIPRLNRLIGNCQCATGTGKGASLTI